MIDMGVPGYLVASSVVAIVAQRLVRTICPKCRARYTPPQSVLEEVGLTEEQIKNATFMRGKGCNSCQKTGFRGRIGIYELMMVDSQVRQMIFDNQSTTEIRKYAITDGGMSTLFRDGVDKVLSGITTFEEVYRVAKRTEQDD
jgi:type IV pilus assembly protein PilB